MHKYMQVFHTKRQWHEMEFCDTINMNIFNI